MTLGVGTLKYIWKAFKLNENNYGSRNLGCHYKFIFLKANFRHTYIVPSFKLQSHQHYVNDMAIPI